MEVLRANEFGHAKTEDILIFEKTNNVRLPDDYRNFLLKYNGGKLSSCYLPVIGTNVHWIYVLSNGPDWVNLFQVMQDLENRLPNWYFAFASDPLGNQFLMSLYEENYGTIAFWDHEREAPKGKADQYFDNMEFVAASFTEFLDMLTDAPENEEA